MKLLTLITLLTISSSALACRYIIDKTKYTNELMAVAIANITGGSDSMEITTQDPLKLSWKETIPTPMCPEEVTFTLKANIGYTIQSPAQNAKFCFGEITVVKIESWNSLSADSYTVLGVKTMRCTR